MATTEHVRLKGAVEGRASEVLTPEALGFIARLQREFGGRRQELLRLRDERQARLDAGEMPQFLVTTSSVRDSEWEVAKAPKDLQDRRVEITGPTDRKMLINALNSGARVFMADFEDANSPTWSNLVEGQVNLIDAIERRIDFTSPEGKEYRLNDKVATLLVRPRGWHLDERHVEVDGKPISGGLFDFGLYFFHNVERLLKKGSGPYFYLPKLESHLEANRVALAKVKEDKDREAGDGFDGTWVAHPDLVATATEAFDRVLGDRPNQLERQRPEVSVKAARLIDVKVPGGTITENGVRTNVSVGIQYIESWMRGTGAAAINNLIEDVATAEISRSQVWQWVKHASRLDDGAIVTADLVREIADDEMSKLRERFGEEGWKTSRFGEARKVCEEVALSKDFQPFLTLVALKHIN